MASKQNKQQEDKKGFSFLEIQEIEAIRKEPQMWNVIHLLKHGDYWRAHEWSCWLVAVVLHNEIKQRYPEEESAALSVIKTFVKNINNEDAFVGFPEKSFDKFMPSEFVTNWLPVGDLQIDVSIELPAELGEISYERLLQMFTEWKASLPLQEEKKKVYSNQQDGKGRNLPFDKDGCNPGIASIITKVLSFQLFDHSPMEAYEFLGELQKELLKHF